MKFLSLSFMLLATSLFSNSNYQIIALDELAKVYSNKSFSLESLTGCDHDLERALGDITHAHLLDNQDVVLWVKKGTRISTNYFLSGLFKLQQCPLIPDITFDKDVYIRKQGTTVLLSSDLKNWQKDRKFFKQYFKLSFESRGKNLIFDINTVVNND